MLEGDASDAPENGDLSSPHNHSPATSFSSSNSPSLQRFVSAPEFIFRTSTPVQQSSNPSHNGKESNISPSDSMNNFFPSTTFLHAYDRPIELPKKDPQEARRHRIECDKLMQNITRKHHENLMRLRAERKRRNADAEKAENRINYWRNDVIPNWDTALQSANLHTDWWYGIPSSLRCQVWQMIIGNPLGITRELFEGCLSQSQHTIRRLDRERLSAEDCDLSIPPPSTSQPASSTKYATLPTRPLPRTSRINSLSNEGDGEYSSLGSVEVEAEELVSTPHPRTLMRRISLNVTGVVETLTIPRRILTAPSTPLSPSPSFSIAGDLSSNEEASLQVIRLDVSRTFPMLGVFQSEGSHLRNLHDLLAAYVAYQPSLGYLQGMSFIAGILLIVMDDIYTAFIAFATLMNRPSFYAFYSLDESEFATYFSAFDALLGEKMPKLAHHLKTCRLDSKLYLFDWLFTVFSRSLPLEVDLRIWDLFLRDGEAALILAALGILKMYEDQLLLYDFDHLASFLTGPMPESMSPDILAECMRSFDLSTTFIKEALKKARTLVARSANKRTGQLSPLSAYDPRAPVETVQENSEGKRSKWSLRSLGLLPVNGSSRRGSNIELMNLSRFTSLRQKNASPGSDANAANIDLITPWSQDVCLEFPKREML